jgi:serine/threonine protein kinase
MELTPGTRLGPYEIVAPIGAGGMGVVYRARDQRLGRDVAIKVIATDRGNDPALLARLEQEARTAASLNHPNIVAIFDVGTHEGAPYIVSELLDGETLRDRLASGPISIRRAIETVAELADALGTAHARGVVHRDLKPENIFLTTEGRAKILDFGLAKAAPDALAVASGAATVLKTLPGVVMGTVGYMSPEQVGGRPIDHRTDIFSLGAVLGEMVTGQRTFKRSTAAETMAAIIQDDPQLASTLNPAVPATLDRIIQRCLEKSPGARFQSASDLAFALSTVGSSGSHGVQPQKSGGTRSPLLQTAAVAAIAASLGGLLAWYAARRAPERTVSSPKHFTIDTGSMPFSESTAPLALSPDGTKLVVSLGSYQGAQLYLRSLDRPDLQPIPGTVDAFNPFFSPDGEWVGFFTSSELRKAPVSGGPALTICRAGGLIRGGATWASDGTIYFAPYAQSSTPGTKGSGILSVPASGGEPTVVTTLTESEVAHRDPIVLPGGRALVFTVIYGNVAGNSNASFQRPSRVVLRSLDTGTQRTLVDGASWPRYLSTGHLLYLKSGVPADTLLAAPFDARRQETNGRPVVVSDSIASWDGYSLQMAVANDGTLAYLARTAMDHRLLVWADRHGDVTPLPFGERWFDTPRLSPDGTRIAAIVRDKGQADAWVQERVGPLSRLTFDGIQTGLVWTTDGRAITFSTLVDGKGAILAQQVEGDRASRLLYSASHGVWPGSWSRDGQTLAFMESVNSGDVNVLRDGETTPTALVNSPATEWGARLSPDDRWIAYSSNESGHWEVYVKPYPGSGARRQISNGGGAEVVWARSGRELFYRNGTKLMAVTIETTPAFSAGEPRVLFDGPFASSQPGLPGYDVAPDGQRFLMVKRDPAEGAQRPIHVVINWFNELARLTATAR